MRGVALPPLALLAIAIAACGAKVVVDQGAAGGAGGGGLDCAHVSSDFGAATLACTKGPDGCSLSGTLPDGRGVREECSSTTTECSLYVDDTLACSCPPERIDFGNTCQNGVPTCSGWLFNWSTAELCTLD